MTEEQNSAKPIPVIVEIEINGQMSILSAFVLGTQAAMRLGVHGVRFDYDDLNCRAFWDGHGTAYEWSEPDQLVGQVGLFSNGFEWTEYGEKLMAERREAKEREERERREAEGMRNSYVPRAVLDAEGSHVPNCGCPECQAKCEDGTAVTVQPDPWYIYIRDSLLIASVVVLITVAAFWCWHRLPALLSSTPTTVEFAASVITDEIDMWQRIIDGRRHALKWAQEQGLTPVRVECELSRCVVEATAESWYLQGCLDGECEIRQRNFETAKPLPDGYCWDCLSGQCKAVPCTQ